MTSKMHINLWHPHIGNVKGHGTCIIILKTANKSSFCTENMDNECVRDITMEITDIANHAFI